MPEAHPKHEMLIISTSSSQRSMYHIETITSDTCMRQRLLFRLSLQVQIQILNIVLPVNSRAPCKMLLLCRFNRISCISIGLRRLRTAKLLSTGPTLPSTGPIETGNGPEPPASLPRPRGIRAGTPLPVDLGQSAAEARNLVRAGAALTSVVAGVGTVLLSGPGDTASMLCFGAGVVGLPVLLFANYRVQRPLHSLPLTLLGGSLAGCFVAPFSWDVAAYAPELIPVYLAATLGPAVLGTEVGTRLAEACGGDRDAFSRAVFALEAALAVLVVVACTKYAIDRTTGIPIGLVGSASPAATPSHAGPTAALSASMSALGAAWWSVFVGSRVPGGRTTPLAAALFALLSMGLPGKEVAGAFIEQLKAHQKGAGQGAAPLSR